MVNKLMFYFKEGLKGMVGLQPSRAPWLAPPIPPYLYKPFELLETKQGNLENWENNLYNSDSKIGMLLGCHGSGKTLFAMRLIENVKCKSKKTIYVMGFKKEDVPDWLQVVTDVDQLPNDCFLIVDEGGISFSSRNSLSYFNKLLSKLLFISRHRNLSVLFVVQNSSNIDINCLRMMDYLILKRSSLLQMDFERKKIQEIYKRINNDFLNYKSYVGITYIYSDIFEGFINNGFPSFWSDNISKSFRDNGGQ